MKPAQSLPALPAFLLFLLAGATLTGTACSAGPDPRVFRVGLAALPRTLDPVRLKDEAGILVASQLFEGLVRVDAASGAVEPALAASWTVSPDGLEYRFALASAVWSDGSPVLAQDVRESWLRMLDPALKAPFGWFPAVWLQGGREYYSARADVLDPPRLQALREAVGISTPDEHTVVVRLARPDSRFPWALGHFSFWVLPAAALADWTAQGISPANFRGSAAFVPAALVPAGSNPDCPGGSLSLKPNSLYRHSESVWLQEVRFLALEPLPGTPETPPSATPDSAAGTPASPAAAANGPAATSASPATSGSPATAPSPSASPAAPAASPVRQTGLDRAWQAGTVDHVPFLSAERRQDYLADPGFTSGPAFATYYYIFNTRSPALRNPAVRQALALGVDTADLVDNLINRGMTAAGGIVPAMPGLAALPARSPDPAKARELLAGAGYDGTKQVLSLQLVVNKNESNVLVAEYLVAAWARLGVKTELQSLDLQEYLARQETRSFDVLRSGWQALHLDPVEFLERFVSGSSQNDAGYANPAYDSAVRQLRGLSWQPGQLAASLDQVRRAETLLLDDQVVLPILQYAQQSLLRPGIWTGWESNVLGRQDYSRLQPAKK